MFKSELEMSNMFEIYLKINFGSSYFKEFQGLFGIPDFVYYSKVDDEVSIISFELKLKDWKRAAKQAFRYKSFSNISYVVLSAYNVDLIYNNIEIFKKYNIGLAIFGKKNNFEIIYKPEAAKPFSNNMNSKIISRIDSINKNLRIYETFFL